MDIRLRDANARSLLSFFDPRFHFGQVPHHATRRQIEAAWELAAALHFVDRRFSQGDDLPQFLAADGATEGQDTALRELWEIVVGVRAGQGNGYRARRILGAGVSAVELCRVILHIALRERSALQGSLPHEVMVAFIDYRGNSLERREAYSRTVVK